MPPRKPFHHSYYAQKLPPCMWWWLYMIVLLSWRLLLVPWASIPRRGWWQWQRNENSWEFPCLFASHTCQAITIDTSRDYCLLEYTIERRLMSLPCSACDFLLLSCTTIWLTDHTKKFRHHPPRNTNATLKGPIIAENPRNFRLMFRPIYRPSSDGRQFEVLYSNKAKLSPHSQNFNLLRPQPADFQARSDPLRAIRSSATFR